MKSAFVDAQDFEKIILENWKIVDVRAPVEFEISELPNSVNIPILENSEREKVGTCFKQRGRELAIQLGHELVDGEKKRLRVARWQAALQDEKSVITCWRGGLRSQISQEWTAQAGTDRPRLKGGYKALRNYLLEQMDEILHRRHLIVVSGTTGSGKTLCLRELKERQPVLDMEERGRHRGSAFGAYDCPQPAQATYENSLAVDLIQLDRFFKDAPIILEDESRMLGKLVNPEILFNRLRASPVVIVEEPIEARVEVIYQDYIMDAGLLDPQRQEKVSARYLGAMQAISKKLGGLRYQEVVEHFTAGQHRSWIEKLLVWYYDPLYRKSLEVRQPPVLFRGSRKEVTQFLSSPPSLSAFSRPARTE